MSDLVRNATEGIRPATAGWTYLSFRTVRRKPDEELSGQTRNEETALIWLGGTADVDGFGQVGERGRVRRQTLCLAASSRCALSRAREDAAAPGDRLSAG